MSEAAGEPIAVPVLNPWAFCTGCGGNVDARAGGRNVPCGCVADVGSTCSSWDLWFGCRCSHVDPPLDPAEVEAAAALQQALEHEEHVIMRERAVRRLAVALDLPPDVLGLPEDPTLVQAARLRAFLGWAAFVVAVVLIAGLWAAGGPW